MNRQRKEKTAGALGPILITSVLFGLLVLAVPYLEYIISHKVPPQVTPGEELIFVEIGCAVGCLTFLIHLAYQTIVRAIENGLEEEDLRSPFVTGEEG